MKKPKNMTVRCDEAFSLAMCDGDGNALAEVRVIVHTSGLRNDVVRALHKATRDTLLIAASKMKQHVDEARKAVAV